MESNKNNFELKGKLKLNSSVKKIDKKAISIMLETVVPLGYSYICNEELKEGIIRFNKSTTKGTTKDSLEKEAVSSLIKHKSVNGFQVISSELCPIEFHEMSYHCPIPYVNKSIMLDD